MKSPSQYQMCVVRQCLRVCVCVCVPLVAFINTRVLSVREGHEVWGRERNVKERWLRDLFPPENNQQVRRRIGIRTSVLFVIPAPAIVSKTSPNVLVSPPRDYVLGSGCVFVCLLAGLHKDVYEILSKCNLHMKGYIHFTVEGLTQQIDKRKKYLYATEADCSKFLHVYYWTQGVESL